MSIRSWVAGPGNLVCARADAVPEIVQFDDIEFLGAAGDIRDAS